MDLENYINIIWPILERSNKLIEENNHSLKLKTKTISKADKHIWYLYRQAFYGFASFVENRIFYSKEFLAEFNKFNSNTELRNLTWETQTAYDKGREKFILEHMYTGTMFRTDVYQDYQAGLLNNNSVKIHIENKYAMCWITKNENEKLDKQIREIEGGIKNYKDLITYYNKQEIKLTT